MGNPLPSWHTAGLKPACSLPFWQPALDGQREASAAKETPWCCNCFVYIYLWIYTDCASPIGMRFAEGTRPTSRPSATCDDIGEVPLYRNTMHCSRCDSDVSGSRAAAP